jgi:hypothetical protein
MESCFDQDLFKGGFSNQRKGIYYCAIISSEILMVSAMKNIYVYFCNNLAYSWLMTAHGVTNPMLLVEHAGKGPTVYGRMSSKVVQTLYLLLSPEKNVHFCKWCKEKLSTNQTLNPGVHFINKIVVKVAEKSFRQPILYSNILFCQQFALFATLH